MVFLMGNWNRQPPRFYSSASASWGCIIFISSRIFCFSIPPWSIGPLVLMVFAGVSGHLGPTLIGSIRRVHRRTIFGTGLDTGATVDLVGPRAIQQTWGKTHGEVCFWLGLLQVATKTKDDDMFTPFTLVHQWFFDGIQTKTSTEIIAGEEKNTLPRDIPTGSKEPKETTCIAALHTSFFGTCVWYALAAAASGNFVTTPQHNFVVQWPREQINAICDHEFWHCNHDTTSCAKTGASHIQSFQCLEHPRGISIGDVVVRIELIEIVIVPTVGIPYNCSFINAKHHKQGW